MLRRSDQKIEKKPGMINLVVVDSLMINGTAVLNILLFIFLPTFIKAGILALMKFKVFKAGIKPALIGNFIWIVGCLFVPVLVTAHLSPLTIFLFTAGLGMVIDSVVFILFQDQKPVSLALKCAGIGNVIMAGFYILPFWS